MASQATGSGYPPYNIEKAGDDAYRIVMAVAGFAEAELNVTQKEDELLVTGQTAPNGRTTSSTSIAASPAATSSAASSSPTM